LSEDALAFPIRFRGYDRNAVDWELHELRVALDYAQAERDRAVARALAVEGSDRTGVPASATVQWLIETAEEDARRIREEAAQSASECTGRAEELLRHRVELIDQAQREADACRAKAAEDARDLVRDALDKAETLLGGLRESEAALRRLFDSGALAHMPPPRGPIDDRIVPSPAPHRFDPQRIDPHDDDPHTGPIGGLLPQLPVVHNAGEMGPKVVAPQSPENAS
jgi:hypothetical protein